MHSGRMSAAGDGHRPSRREFLKGALLTGVGWGVAGPGAWAQPDPVPAIENPIRALPPHRRWLKSARVFLVDAYAYPFTPDLEFDAMALASAMSDVKANVVRMATMGKYATIQGVAFARHPRQGDRDLLAEVIAACKPSGVRVVPYISTGHKLAWSMVTRDFPQYAHVSRPGGGPVRTRFGTGEDHGTVCWNTPYRKAYLDLVRHVVEDYDVDGVYFDSWMACYFWPRPATCYCDGCRSGFSAATGLAIPFRENIADYTAPERETIRRYHAWYQDQLVGVLEEVRGIVKGRRDIPLIYNINNPERLLGEDPRVVGRMDAFLYEHGQSMLHRAEGVSLASATGLAVWPYVSTGVSARVIGGRLNVQQEIFVTSMFGGAPIVYGAYQFARKANGREHLRFPFGVIANHEECFQNSESYPYIAVVWGTGDPQGHRGGKWGGRDVRSSTLGAFAACLRRHNQVTSVLQDMLDDPIRLARYRVIYIAGIPHLSPSQIRNLRDFVEGGGGLIVSHGASLWRQERDAVERPAHLFRQGFVPDSPPLVRLERFGLEDLIRVRPASPDAKNAALADSHSADLPGFQDLYLRIIGDGDFGKICAAKEIVPVLDYEPVTALDGGEVVAEIMAGESESIAPGIVLSRHGKGRVAYVAPALEGVLLKTNSSLILALIEGLVSWVAADPPPYVIRGAEDLIANLVFCNDQRVLHLTNWRAENLEATDADLSRIAPVEDVRVRLHRPTDREIGQASLMVDGAFDRRDNDDDVEITLRRVEAYQAIRFSLSPRTR